MATDELRRHGFLVRYLTLFGGEAASKVAVLVAFGYLARTIGPAGLGIVELAFSTTVFFVLAAEMGLGSYGARLIEASPSSAARLIPRAGLVRAVLAAVAYAALLGLAWRAGSAGMGLLAICGLTVLLTPFNTAWVFQGLGQMQWVSLATLLRYTTFATLVFLLVRPGSNVRIVVAAEVAGALVLAMVNVFVLRRVLKIRLDWSGAWRGARDVFGDAWFLGASDLTWAAMWYAPTIVLGWIELHHPEQVAWLAAAVRIVMALHMFVFLYFFNLVPDFSRELRMGLESWRALMSRSMAVSMWAAGFFAVAGTLGGPALLTIVFGDVYEAAVLPFRIAIWMIPVAWLSGHFRFGLIAAGRQDLEFRAAAIAAIVTIVASLGGAYFFGAVGAAAALLTGGVLNAVLAGIAISRVVSAVALGPAMPALSTCVGAVVLGLAAGAVIGRPLGAALGCGLYAAVTASQFDLTGLRAAWEGRNGGLRP